ncbi:TPA: hypothetical protein JI034_10375 [Acinetobacter baumannii]|uniref:hypothetical protein n=1 Tax=Acinetobacter calcoaceticus/baumannii complex TaxID=909768 RepID=UPI0007E9269D|nr:hypothetical protein [Acinetobacter baumannii]MDP7840884.1 hypothetical protein [Acinetobacter baumannii]MDP7863491.1 hypothetical protein [Acinetobacter baumannii]SBS21252.1 Uncharacterised protein [Acinetobacter baumannii]HAV2932525.1 hypothetical protein [Acinetobacter baumannii]HAV3087515.1 hypothetical protein [Acinetobacter baumannii]
MDSKWLEEQRHELAKLLDREIHCPIGFHNLRNLYELEIKARGRPTLGFPNLPHNLYKPDPIIKLKEDLAKLVEKYKQDAHALTLLGDLDKSRVYNGIANQLDQLLKG